MNFLANKKCSARMRPDACGICLLKQTASGAQSVTSPSKTEGFREFEADLSALFMQINMIDTGRSNFTNLKAIGSYSGNVAYCIEPGISLKVGQTMNKYDENYFNNLAANGVISGNEIRLFVGRILQYGYHEWKLCPNTFPLQVMGCRRKGTYIICF